MEQIQLEHTVSGSVFFLQPGMSILQTGSGNFCEIQLVFRKNKKKSFFLDFSKIFEKMTLSKTEIGQKLQKHIFILGFWVVVFGARRASGNLTLIKHWCKSISGYP